MILAAKLGMFKRAALLPLATSTGFFFLCYLIFCYFSFNDFLIPGDGWRSRSP